MKWLLAKIGVDDRHFLALVKLAWRMDMRASRMGFGWNQEGRNPLVAFISTTAFYFVLGILFAVLAFQSTSIFVGASFMLGSMMFMLGGLMLVEYNTIIISPDDYQILGYMPISSRTYFVVKMVNVLGYMLFFSLLMGGPTVIAYAWRGGFHPLRGLLALIGIVGSGVFMSLTIIGVYGYLLRVVSPTRMRSVLSYVQFGVSLFLYTGYLFLPKVVKQYLVHLDIVKTPWLLLSPTSWFAAFIELAFGDYRMITWIGVALAVGTIVLLWRASLARVSLVYAQRIANLSTQGGESTNHNAAEKPKSKFSFVALFHQPATRVVVRLVQGQFRYDNKFRLSVLGFVPLLVVYFVIGLEKGALPDPFVSLSSGIEKFFIFFFALLMMPMAMKQNIEGSDAFAASWIFYASPMELSRLVLAARNVLFLLFSLPALLFIFLVFGYYFGDWLHALLHTTTLTALSFIFLQIVYLMNPKLPFAEPKVRGSQTRQFTFLLFLLPILGLGILYLVTGYFYASQLRLFGLFAGFVILMRLLETFIRKRVEVAVRKLQLAD